MTCTIREYTKSISLFVILWVAPISAAAQHSDLEIGSSADGSGVLLVEFPFDEVPVLRVTDSGFPGLFTGEDPGFEAVEADEPGLFELDALTEISLEIVVVDEGVSLFLNNGVDAPALLDAPGDIARVGVYQGSPDIHQHPNYQLLLSGAPDAFMEGSVYFKLSNTAGGAPYGDSEVVTFKLSNGYLAPLEAPSVDDAKCQKTVGKAVRKILNKNYKTFSKCFDKLTSLRAGGSQNAAVSACTLATLTAKLDDTTQGATDAIAQECGPLSGASTPFTQTEVATHLGMANCRVQEMASAGYNGGFEHLAELLLEAGQIATEDELADAFPCLHNSAGE